MHKLERETLQGACVCCIICFVHKDRGFSRKWYVLFLGVWVCGCVVGWVAFSVGVVNVPVLLLVNGSLDVVFVHELVELIKLDNTVLVFVYLLEESSDFMLLEAHIEVAWEVSLEAL